MKLSEVVLATHGELIGEDVEINSVGIDSRSIKQGQLFVAIKGENFDGHDYVAQSLSGGAAAALVEVHKNTTAVKVKDTRLALGDLAAYWRKKIKAPR
jgi:UDP-N-acetylmuramoyl-tripeptide--D-alanyl-D-alanine ligase